MLIRRDTNAEDYRHEPEVCSGYDGLFDVTRLDGKGNIVTRTYSPVIRVGGAPERFEPLYPGCEAYLKMPLEDDLVQCLRRLLEKRKKEN